MLGKFVLELFSCNIIKSKHSSLNLSRLSKKVDLNYAALIHIYDVYNDGGAPNYMKRSVEHICFEYFSGKGKG